MKMKRLLRIMAGLATLLAVPVQVEWSAEESTWDRYVAGTLAAVIKQHEADASQTESDRYFTTQNFPSRVKVVYLGKQRSVPKERSSFLDQYFKSMKQPEFRKLFKSEVL